MTTHVRTLAIVTAALAASAIIASNAAVAACRQWDVTGTWQVLQSNGFITNVSFRQNGTNLVGNANYTTKARSGSAGAKDSGQLDGTIRGNAINFTIYWGTSTVGAYTGTIGPTGRIEGTTYDKRKPASKAAWHSSARMRCAR